MEGARALHGTPRAICSNSSAVIHCDASQASRARPRPRDAGGGGRRQSAGKEELPRHRRGEPASGGPLPAGEAAIGAFRPEVRRVKRAAGGPLRPVFRGENPPPEMPQDPPPDARAEGRLSQVESARARAAPSSHAAGEELTKLPATHDRRKPRDARDEHAAEVIRHHPGRRSHHHLAVSLRKKGAWGSLVPASLSRKPSVTTAHLSLLLRFAVLSAQPPASLVPASLSRGPSAPATAGRGLDRPLTPPSPAATPIPGREPPPADALRRCASGGFAESHLCDAGPRQSRCKNPAASTRVRC